MGMGVIHGQQAGSHCGFEKFSSAARPTEISNQIFQNLHTSQLSSPPRSAECSSVGGRRAQLQQLSALLLPPSSPLKEAAEREPKRALDLAFYEIALLAASSPLRRR